MAKFKKNDVVQFIENHKWESCFGIISEVRESISDMIGYENDYKYLIGVPVPYSGIAYIYSMESDHEFEYIGKAVIGLLE